MNTNPNFSSAKILQITGTPYTIETLMIPLIQRLQSLGARVDGMTHDLTTSSAAKVLNKSFDVPISRNPMAPVNYLTVVPMMREIIESEQYDIIHIHSAQAAFVARLAVRHLVKKGKPKVLYTSHGLPFAKGLPWYYNLPFMILEKIASRWTDYLVLVNHEDVATANRINLMPSDRIRYVPGDGTDLSIFNENIVTTTQIASVRKEISLDQDDKLLVMVAEFQPRKRHADVIKALSQIDDKQLHLVLVGDGALFEKMKEMVNVEKLTDRVHFLGFRQDVPVIISAGFALILVSKREGLPQCVQEAMCLKRPIIGTNIRGTRDLVMQDAGILVETGDIGAIRDAIVKLKGDPDLASQMGENGYKRVHQYDINNVLDFYQNLFAEILNK